MLYVFPLVFAVGGVNFPVGVLIYWFTSNLWTMGQQFYVIRRNPAPGTPAYDAWERDARPRARLMWPWLLSPILSRHLKRRGRTRRRWLGSSHDNNRASNQGPSANAEIAPKIRRG